LNTDASFRFERGVDPNITRTAITHAIKLIQKLQKVN
jgi:phenylalanyl-tRNA synthetase beta chain